VQHFCSYLTENITRVYFKKAEELKLLRGKGTLGLRTMRNTAPRANVQRLRMLQ